MKYIVNHIIRSLSRDAIVGELQEKLLGKTLSFSSRDLVIRNIELKKSSLFLYHKEGVETIHGIKKIVHDQHTSSIRLHTQKQTFIFSYQKKENVSL